jgi:hypothetical protein
MQRRWYGMRIVSDEAGLEQTMKRVNIIPSTIGRTVCTGLLGLAISSGCTLLDPEINSSDDSADKSDEKPQAVRAA